jgi:hypothetical protein
MPRLCRSSRPAVPQLLARRRRKGAATRSWSLSPLASAHSGWSKELRNEGYAADGVEVDGGPARGRFVQVKISGYTSATEVERALQRIRELPGGYADARVIESN